CIGGPLSAGAATAAAGAAGAAPRTGAGSRETLIRRSPSATSISVSALSVRSCASSRTSAGSMRIAPSFEGLASAIALPYCSLDLLDLALALARARSLAELGYGVQCEHIAERAQANDRAAADLADQAGPPEPFAGVDIRQMDFDHRHWQRGDR